MDKHAEWVKTERQKVKSKIKYRLLKVGREILSRTYKNGNISQMVPVKIFTAVKLHMHK